MALEMKVYKDPVAFEPKAMFGLTWRQLAALALGVPLAGGAYALTAWILMQTGAPLDSATNTAMPVLIVLFLPFAAWGWWRPRGLKPEYYLHYVLYHYLSPKVTKHGDDDRHQRDPRPEAGRERRARRRGKAPSEVAPAQAEGQHEGH